MNRFETPISNFETPALLKAVDVVVNEDESVLFSSEKYINFFILRISFFIYFKPGCGYPVLRDGVR